MIDGKRVLAIVPARSGSKGLPGKNVRMLGGKPLLAWPITAALGAAHVDRTILSTDDPSYAEIGLAHGADVPFLRPSDLASDAAPSIDFILHAVETLAAAGDVYEYVLLLEPTSPLTESSDVDAAFAALATRSGDADAVVGVTRLVTTHPAYALRIGEDGRIAPLNGESFGSLPRRQDLEPLFCLDGSLYISTVATLRDRRGFCHERTIGYETARHKAIEIDDLIDFLCAEAILNNADEIGRAESCAPAS